MDDKDIKNLTIVMDHAYSIIKETKNIKNSNDFIENNSASKAVLFDLLQIGELSKYLSVDYVKSSSTPWNDIYNLRNRIVHGYGSVDYEIIWKTVKEDIPKLYNDLKRLLK